MQIRQIPSNSAQQKHSIQQRAIVGILHAGAWNHFICTRRDAEGQGGARRRDEFLMRGEHSGRKVLTTFRDANISPTSPVCPPIASRCKTIYDNNVPGHIRSLLSLESARRITPPCLRLNVSRLQHLYAQVTPHRQQICRSDGGGQANAGAAGGTREKRKGRIIKHNRQRCCGCRVTHVGQRRSADSQWEENIKSCRKDPIGTGSGKRRRHIGGCILLGGRN